MIETARAPTLDEESRRELTQAAFREAAAAQDPADRRRLLNRVAVANLPVSRALARRYGSRGLALEDLEQVADMALVQATRSYDPDLGHDFLSYAVPTITGAIRHYFRDHGWVVRPPRRIQHLQKAIAEQGEAIAAEQGKTPRVADLADALDVSQDEVGEALSASGCFHPVSLDKPTPTGSTAPTDLAQTLAAEDDPFGAAEARVLVGQALAELSPGDRYLLYLRFYEERTQQQIAEALGTSQPQVSRALGRVYRRMRLLVEG